MVFCDRHYGGINYPLGGVGYMAEQLAEGEGRWREGEVAGQIPGLEIGKLWEEWRAEQGSWGSSVRDGRGGELGLRPGLEGEL